RGQRRMIPAPIEQVSEFDVAKYISAQNSGLTIGQACAISPKYRTGVVTSLRRSRPKDTNYVEQEGHQTTSAKCEVLVGKEPVTAVIDSGAATSIMSKSLMDKLNYRI